MHRFRRRLENVASFHHEISRMNERLVKKFPYENRGPKRTDIEQKNFLKQREIATRRLLRGGIEITSMKGETAQRVLRIAFSLLQRVTKDQYRTLTAYYPSSIEMEGFLTESEKSFLRSIPSSEMEGFREAFRGIEKKYGSPLSNEKVSPEHHTNFASTTLAVTILAVIYLQSR